MHDRRWLIRILPIIIALAVVGMRFLSSERVTNETGRTARVALSPEQESQLGFQAYRQVLSEERAITSGSEYELVRRVSERIQRATGEAGRNMKWEFALVQSKQANAFCLPGGKIVVYTGILPITQTEAGLAAVVGHEVAHAIARHGSERLFKEQATKTLMTGVQFSMADQSYETQQWMMSALGAGARYGVLMPWGRGQESEADHLGLLYMARAGYDPREAIEFWGRMEKSGGGKAPEFLSTHPSHGTRVSQLQELLPKAQAEYEKAKR